MHMVHNPALQILSEEKDLLYIFYREGKSNLYYHNPF